MRGAAKTTTTSERAQQQFTDSGDLWFRVTLGVICALVAVLVLAVTARWGIGVSSDSVSYLDAARNLRRGDGLTLTTDQSLVSAVMHKHAPYPLLLWAPLYPVVLAATSVGPWGSLAAARVLDALLLAAIVALVGLLVLRMTQSRIGALIAAGVLAVSPVGLDLYSAVISEPLFVLLSYGAIALLASYLSTEHRVYFWAAAIATALALVTRFAGLPLLGATVLPLAFYGRGGWRLRLGRATAFGCLSLLPLIAWLARNWHLTGSATGRRLGWHPVSPNRFAHGLDALSMLFVPAGVPAIVRGPLALGCVVAVVVAATRSRPTGAPKGFSRYLLASLLVYVVLYPIFLFTSISLIDADTNVDSRFLFPMYPGIVVLAAWVLVRAFRASSVRRVGRIVLAVGLAAFVCGNAVGLAVSGQRIRRDGADYTGRVWQASPAIARIRALPSSTRIYSDRPDAISFLTGREARSIPAISNPIAVQANRQLASDIQDLRQRLTKNDVFVLFNTGRKYYLEDATSLTKELRLVLTSRTADATFYRAPAG